QTFCHDELQSGQMNTARNYLSIGEVLALLLEEFPDVTISKIRFLESQGLIEPERTASGYRKFSQAEVDRLKFILREQRENYLPLKVIRTRLEGDTSDGMLREDEITAPRGLGHIPAPRGQGHPAGVKKLSKAPEVVSAKSNIASLKSNDDHVGDASFNRSEILVAASIDEKTLKELEKFGIVRAHRVGSTDLFDQVDLQILEAAARFIELGIDSRHLKAWRSAADQEVSLFESRVVPMMRQRNPQARQQAMQMFAELVEQGAKLRAALIAAQARDHVDHR
ncbi:MAG: MerR family transcriptional regulator, partial [Acidimicrobiaceae bacterium]